MPLLDRQILTDLGIELGEPDYEALADHFESTLKHRVIEEIVEELTPDQADQLAAARGISDEELLAWLKANVPELAEIVSDEVDILLGELAENAEAFSSNSTANL